MPALERNESDWARLAMSIDIAEIPREPHQGGTVMQKMKADSLPDLVKMAGRLDLAAMPKG